MLRRYAATVVIALVGVTVSVFVAVALHAMAERRVQSQLDVITQNAAAAIQRSLDVHLEVVNSLVAMFRASTSVDRRAFRLFTLPAIHRHRGVQALEWAPRVVHSEREAFERAVREEGFDGFHFTERGDEGQIVVARERDFYYPVLFLEPMVGNETAFGYADMGAIRLDAIERARDEGRAVASKRLRLIQEQAEQFGVIVFAPVYEGVESVPPTQVGRSRAFRGVVEGVFRIDDLVDQGVRGLDLRRVSFSLFDDEDADDLRPLYVHRRLPGEPVPSQLACESDHRARLERGICQRAILHIAGRSWTMIVRPDEGFHDIYWNRFAWLALAAGLIFTLLLVALVGQVQNRASQVQDLVRRRTAEAEAAIERLELARIIIERAVVPVLRLDGAGSVVGVNGAACELYGYGRKEFLGLKAGQVEPRLAGSKWKKHWSKLQHIKALTFEAEHNAKDGLKISVEVTANFLKYGERSFTCWFVRDIAEQRQAEDALRRSKEQLQQSQKLEAIGMLAGGIAHDFNNLLSGILGFSEIGLMKLEANHPVRRHLTEIMKAGNRAASLTRQLLTFSRRQTQKPEVVSINDIVSDMGKMLGRIIGEDVALEIVLGEDTRPVYVDPSHIEQVLLNLSINARDAMPEGGSLVLETTSVHVGDEAGEVSAEQLGLIAADELHNGTYLKLSASDTGTGMTPEVMSHIFEPFFTTKSVGRGTGLGLATVYGIVTQSQGAIAVESQLRLGTTFDIYLPCVTTSKDLPTMYPNEPDRDLLSFPPTKHRRTVLLVEDEETVRDLCFDVLHEYGYEVLQAASGEEALELFTQARDGVDLLLTDVVMSGMTGIELAEAVLAKQPIPIVVMTGYTDRQEQVESIPEVRLLMKPFSPGDLLAEIKDALRTSLVAISTARSSKSEPPMP